MFKWRYLRYFLAILAGLWLISANVLNVDNEITTERVDNYDPGRRNSNENNDNGENVITRHHQQHRKAKTSGRTIHLSDNYQQEYNEGDNFPSSIEPSISSSLNLNETFETYEKPQAIKSKRMTKILAKMLRDSNEEEADNNDPDFNSVSWMTKRAGEIERRKKHLKKICSKFKPDSLRRKPHMDAFAVDEPRKLTACVINKVASSSMVKSFLMLRKVDVGKLQSPHAASKRLKPKTNETLSEVLSDRYYRFLFVRHPFERLYSCYRDKILENKHPSLVGFRRDVKALVHKLMALRSSNYSSTLKVDAKSYLNTVPTFSEFLEFVIYSNLDGDGFASHWVPYYKWCNPCTVEYDFIGHLETGEEDFKYLWKATGLDKEIAIPWENPTFSSSPANNTEISEDSKKAEFLRELAKVPLDLRQRVFVKYKLDFLLFNYGPLLDAANNKP